MKTEEIEKLKSIWHTKLIVEDELAANTIKVYIKAIDLFLDFLKKKQVEDVTKQDVLEFKQSLTQSKSSATVNSRIVALNRFFKDFDCANLTVKPLKTTINLVSDKCINEEEYQDLLIAAKDDEEICLALQTLTETGIRISELEKITVEALKTRKTLVKGKRTERYVFIPKRLARKLRAYCKKNNITEGIIFHGKRNATKGSMFDQAYFRKKIKATAGKVDFLEKEKVHAHAFRHLFAQRFSDMPGSNPYLLPILMGHSQNSLPVTYRYTTPTTEKLKEAVDKVEEYYYNKEKERQKKLRDKQKDKQKKRRSRANK